MKTKLLLCTMALMLIALNESRAQSSDGNFVPVTVNNFIRAESDMYLGNMVKETSLGKFVHRREPASIDNRPVGLPNRDTLYSAAVFDLDSGPVTITLPEAGKRFLSMQVINQDHYVPMMVYGAGSYTLEKARLETRYVAAAIRIIVDPADSNDIKQAQALQDSIRVEQTNPGKFEVPNWDQESQRRVRDALIMLGSTTSDFKQAFGAKDKVDPVQHLIGTALGWGNNPNKEATYRSITPGKNDGTAIHKLVVKDVPADVFWSIGVLNVKGAFEQTEKNPTSLSELTAKKSGDGSVVIQFGGCDGKIANCLSTTPGWTYTVRLYRSPTEKSDDKWTFPLAQVAP